MKNAKKPFTFIDLFAGIGGFHLGMENAGFKFLMASEKDEAARSTYLTNFKESIEASPVKNAFIGDITKIALEELPDFDVLCGGFPCQPFSHAGLQKGFNDHRGNLFFIIRDIIAEKQPKAFFLENVRGLLSHDEGNTFKTIKKIITEDLGYSFHFKLMRGTDFNCPQHRPRIYMVGFKDPKTPFNFPESLPLTKTMSDVFGAPCSRKIGFTMRVGGRGSGINDRRNWDTYLVNGEEKRLTSKEGLMLNGFPDNFKFSVSEAQAMKQLGNSVIVPAIEATANAIKIALLHKNNKK